MLLHRSSARHLSSVLLPLLLVGAIAPLAVAADPPITPPPTSGPSAATRDWRPAQDGELRLELDGGWIRRCPAPGVAEILLRQSGPGPVELQVRRTDQQTGLRLILRADGWQRLALPGFARKGGGIILAGPGVETTCTIAPVDHPDWPEGPGLGHQRLLEVIDLDRPGLEGVKERRDAGDPAGARRALAAYFRHRPIARWTLPDLPSDPTAAVAAADLVVKGDFTMLSNHHVYADGAIDWHLNPTVGGEFRTDEWIWSINRHEIASKLLAAWRVTGNPVYPRAWAQAVRTWLPAMPVPAIDWQSPGSGWRFIEAGLRMGEFWPNAWQGFAACPELTDDDLLGMVASFWEHGEFLNRKDTGLNNHFVVGVTGLYNAASLFPEFREAAGWRTAAARRLQDFVRNGTDGDGGWYERSPGYHQWLVNKIGLVFDTARVNGNDGDFTQEFRDLVRRMAEWNAHLLMPDRTVANQNDTSVERVATIASPWLLRQFPGSTVLARVAGLAASGAAVDPGLPTCELLSSSGFGVMRTSWAADAACLIFDVGPMGGGHGHLDALNVAYAADGATCLFDNTGGTYTDSPFRAWAKSTASHNTVLVDGRNQHRPKESPQDRVGSLPAGTPTPEFRITNEAVYAAGWHIGGYGKDAQVQVRHRRELVFDRRTGITLVIDQMTPTDGEEHAYDLRWHSQTTTWRRTDRGRIVIPEREGKPLFAVVPLGEGLEVHADSGVEKPQILGWDVPKSIAPIPALTIRHLAKAKGPVRFATLLIPGSRLGQEPVVRASGDGWTVDPGNGKGLVIALDPTQTTCRLAIPGSSADLVLQRTSTP